MNGIVAGIAVPVCAFRDGIPFALRAGIVDVFQLCATVKRIVDDIRDAVRNRDAREARAIGERIIADARDALGNLDVRKSRATVKRIIADARDALGNRDARKSRATRKRRIVNEFCICMNSGSRGSLDKNDIRIL